MPGCGWRRLHDERRARRIVNITCIGNASGSGRPATCTQAGHCRRPVSIRLGGRRRPWALANTAANSAWEPGIIDTFRAVPRALQLVVADVNAARAELVERGVEVSEVQELAWGSFVFFSDPDGNRWAAQQLPARD